MGAKKEDEVVTEPLEPVKNTFIGKFKNFDEVDIYRTVKSYEKSTHDPEFTHLTNVEVYPSKLDSNRTCHERVISLASDGNGVNVILPRGDKNYRLDYDELHELKLAIQVYYDDEINNQQSEFINLQEYKNE